MNNLYDLIIIGGGPAGLSAALYAGRSMLRVLVLDNDNTGGQISITEEVVNYPGILKTSGANLTSVMREQAKSFGAEFKQVSVMDIDCQQDIKTVKTSDNLEYRALSILVATGARPRKLGFKGETEYTGRGVAYCATCDGEFFAGMDIFVIGGGFAAAEEAIFLTRFAKKVHMIIREPDFTCAAGIALKVRENKNINLHFDSELLEVNGDTTVRSATIRNNKTDEVWEFKPQAPNTTFGVFVFVGYEPISELFIDKIELDKHGYITTDDDMRTNVNGVYAAGDIRPKRLRQLVTAISDGAIASTSIEKFVEEQKHKLNITIQPVAQEKDATPASGDSFLDDDLVSGLKPILEKFESNIILKITNNPEKQKLSDEMLTFAQDIAKLSDKISVVICENLPNEAMSPSIAIAKENDENINIFFHGVPGGHEFNSFVLAMYNIAGPGQQVDKAKQAWIDALKPVEVVVAATLSCTMCPDVVQATQLIAAKNKNVIAHMVDVSNFPELKEKFNIMSVPAMIVDNKEVYFGKKSLDEIIEML